VLTLASAVLLLVAALGYVSGYFLLARQLPAPRGCVTRCYPRQFVKSAYWPLAKADATITGRLVTICCVEPSGELGHPSYVRGIRR
jgi:hypothetical protein